MICVVIESPYAGGTDEQVEANVTYARAAMADALALGYSPYASHLLYTQPGILDDKDPAQRKLGIEAGFAWRRFAGMTIVYVDLGVSSGMWKGIADSHRNNIPIMWRTIHDRLDLVHAATAEFHRRLDDERI